MPTADGCYHGRTSSVSKAVIKYSGSELLHGPLCVSIFESNSGIGNLGGSEREKTVGIQVRVRETDEEIKIEKREERKVIA
jgi:hypothetical protein